MSEQDRQTPDSPPDASPETAPGPAPDLPPALEGIEPDPTTQANADVTPPPDAEDAATSSTPAPAASGSGAFVVPGDPSSTDKLVLCPYCGATQRGGNRCHTCGGLFELLSQKATQIAMGPWYIRDKANPFRPGCSYEVLRKMVDGGRIKPTTVLRGPTTKQFWSIARNVEGVSHLLGYCYACGAHVEKTDASCEDCGVPFRVIETRNELGLRYETKREAEKAQRELDDQVDEAMGVGKPKPKPKPAPGKPRKRTSLTADDVSVIKPRPGMLDDDDLSPEPAPARPGAKALDFAPDEAEADRKPSRRKLSAFETEDERDHDLGLGRDRPELERRIGVSPAVWVLGTLNIVAMAGVALLYVWVNRG